MKIQSLVMTLAIAASTTLSGIAFAQTATPVVDQKAANQQQRINQGVASGELTRGEAVRLQKRQTTSKQIGCQHTTRQSRRCGDRCRAPSVESPS